MLELRARVRFQGRALAEKVVRTEPGRRRMLLARRKIKRTNRENTRPLHPSGRSVGQLAPSYKYLPPGPVAGRSL